MAICGLAIVVRLAAPTTCFAQAAAPSAVGQAPVATQAKSAQQLTAEFAGLSFGIGLSFTSHVGQSEPIDEAIVDEQGIVRATKRHSGIARVMLEAHYFWTPTAKTTGPAADPPPPRIGLGPFVAIQPGSDEIIKAIAGGIMLGFRRTDTSKSFNVGVGVVSDMNARVLGNGLTLDMPAPVDSSGKPVAIRYEEDTQYGIVLLTSFAW
jgi:hypothetical protein